MRRENSVGSRCGVLSQRVSAVALQHVQHNAVATHGGEVGRQLAVAIFKSLHLVQSEQVLGDFAIAVTGGGVERSLAGLPGKRHVGPSPRWCIHAEHAALQGGCDCTIHPRVENRSP